VFHKTAQPDVQPLIDAYTGYGHVRMSEMVQDLSAQGVAPEPEAIVEAILDELKAGRVIRESGGSIYMWDGDEVLGRRPNVLRALEDHSEVQALARAMDDKKTARKGHTMRLERQLIRLGSEKPHLQSHIRPVLDVLLEESNTKQASKGVIDFRVLDEIKDIDKGSQQAFTNLRHHAEKAKRFESDRDVHGVLRDVEHVSDLFVEMRHLSHDLESEALELENRFKQGLDRLKKIKAFINTKLDDIKPIVEERNEEYKELLDEKGSWTRDEEQAAQSLYQVLQFIPDAKIS